MQNRKLQVFVSSTFTDLKVERQAAVEAILTAGHIPAGMELFTAGDQSQWNVIKRWIDESDVYMLLLGGRYGSIDATTGLSYTHMEYNYALEQGKSLFALVLDESYIELKAKAPGVKISDVKEEDNVPLYKDFKATIRSKLVNTCVDIKDITIYTTRKLSELSHNNDLIGWIRGDRGVNNSLISEQIAKLTKENQELRESLTKAKPDNSTYNGLTFDQVTLLLTSEGVNNLEGAENLYELFLLLGPDPFDIVKFTRDYEFASAGETSLKLAIEKLVSYKIYQKEVNSMRMFKATEAGHDYYLKALVYGHDLT